MKKLFACFVLAGFLFASCGGSSETETTSPETTPTEVTSASDTTAPVSDTTNAAPASEPAAH